MPLDRRCSQRRCRRAGGLRGQGHGQGAGGFHEEKDVLVVLPALGVVVVARVVGHAADVARVRPSLVPAARADTSDFANSVLRAMVRAPEGSMRK